MNRCLCCGKPIPENASERERAEGWHTACIRKFFGVNDLPELDISEDALIRIAAENTNRRFTIPGVQKKMSLHLSSDKGTPRLTIVDYPTGFILKPQTREYANLPEAEYLVMRMAEKTGISTVPFALIHMAGKTESMAYITKRIDRIFPKKRSAKVERLAMEDFCQLEGHLTENKYLGSYERCAKVISRYSARAGLDLSELFLRVVFSFAIGNSDMHLKNFSMIETEAASGEYILSKAYDLLPVNLVVPEDNDEMVLTLNGKKRNLRRTDFLKFASASGIAQEAAMKMIRHVVSMKPVYLDLCGESYLPDEMKERYSALIEERSAILGQE